MELLIPALVERIGCTLVLTVTFYYVFTNYRVRPFGIWAMAWMTGALRLVFSFMLLSNAALPGVVIGDHTLGIVSSVLLLWGAYEFIGRPLPDGWSSVGIVVTFWIAMATFLNLDFLRLSLPICIFRGLAMIWVGSLFFRDAVLRGLGKNIVGAAFTLWGVNVFAYPFVGAIPGLDAWQFITAAVLELIVGIGILLLFFGKARRDLEYGEGRYRTLAENARDLIYRYNLRPEPVFEYVNPACAVLSGYSQDEFYADPHLFRKLVHPDDLTAMEEYRQAAGEKSQAILLRWRRKDGQVIWVEQLDVPVQDDSGRVVSLQGIVRNVTEHQKATEALRHREEYFRALIENALDVITILDKQGRVKYQSPSVERALGYTVDELVGDSLLNLLHPDDREKAKEFLASGMGGGPAQSIVLRVRHKNGSWRVFESMGKSFLDNPAVDGFVINSRDATQHRRDAEALRESEARYRSLVEVSPEAMVVVRDGRLAYVNPAGVKLLGAARQGELLGMKLQAFIDSDYWPVFHARLELVEQCGRPQEVNEGRLVRLDGGGVEIEETVAQIIYAGQAAIQVIFKDISQRKQNEYERVLLSTAVEQAAEAILIIDTDAVIKYVNPAFAAITGYGAKEAIGQNPRILKSGWHDEAYYRKMWECLSSGESWSGRFVNRRKDGSNFEWESVISPVRDANGKTICYVSVNRDVSQELALEEQLRQAQKMEAIGQLAGGVAHDFNNLLTVITCYGGIVKNAIGKAGDAGVMEDLEEVLKAAERASTLTRQLLAFSRRQILTPRVVNLNETILEMKRMLQRLIREEIELEMQETADLGLVKADPGQIEQVIVNLIINARDAIAKSGHIAVETGNVSLDEDDVRNCLGLQAGDYVEIKVIDSGLGMSKETQERIFEPFFTTKKRGQGVGLGLATAYGIIKQHEGHIQVESKLGQGTCFRILLPRIKATVDQDSAQDGENGLVGGSETILVAEDDAVVRAVAVRILHFYGYNVLATADGTEALEVANSYQGDIHLLLTDVVMPKMDGKALADQLRQVRPKTKIIFCSGYADERIAHRGVLDGEELLLHKPYAPDKLARAVRSVLDGLPVDRDAAAPGEPGDPVFPANRTGA